MSKPAPIALVVHGGAWAIPNDLVERHRQGVHEALKAGWSVLVRGGSAVEAVEQSIVVMENDDVFNAGRGSVLNAAGEIELDAGIMNGKTFQAGAVAAVQQVKNPITLARAIMEKSDTVLLVGMGAVRFAREHGIPTCGLDDLITRREIDRWREAQAGDKQSRGTLSRTRTGSDTVGAVALDKAGTVVSGTSTGGTPNKPQGRVGDSPLIGCGTYAENAVGAVATTGWGEAMIRVVMAKAVIDIMDRNGRDPEAAVREGLALLQKKTGGTGGIIAVSPEGRVGIAYNTPRMARAYMHSSLKTPVVAV
jgi:beta-aspartyl-peptidase (threonine type)